MKNSKVKNKLIQLKEKFKNNLIELNRVEKMKLTHYDKSKIQEVRRLLFDAIEMLEVKYI